LINVGVWASLHVAQLIIILISYLLFMYNFN
jgi:hypothetical protein